MKPSGFLPHRHDQLAHTDAVQALLEPFSHISTVPGKDIRGAMTSAFNQWLNVPEDKLHIITKVIGMLHNASLLCAPCLHPQSFRCDAPNPSIDDIEDDSHLRRGQPGKYVLSMLHSLDSI